MILNRILKKMSRLLLITIGVTLISLSSCTKEETPGTPETKETSFATEQIKDGSGNVIETIVTVTDFGKGTGTTIFTNNKTWVLKGMVFVNANQTLEIEEGTVIKGKSGQGENASALVVAQNATIKAQGTAINPIIFTSESDQIRRKVGGSGFENGGNLPATARGLWGGLIVLGSAVLNSSPGVSAVEGIPTSEKRGLYGGNDDNDNSGILTYVSIRHGGTDIGSGNEINGLTLGGVGSKTVINHIEVIANNDDGIECFGGTARIKNAVITNCGDDAFDYDEGFRGLIQYLLIYQPSDRGGEHDGGTKPEDGIPYATPVFANVTSMGRGESAGKRAITFRDNAGGEYWNSLFTEWGKGMDIEDLGAGKEHSFNRLSVGDLKLMHNTFWNVADNNATAITLIYVAAADSTYNASNETHVVGNKVEDLNMNGVLTGNNPTAIWTNFDDLGWFDKVTYKGAFNPDGSDNWHEGWTLTDESAIIQ